MLELYQTESCEECRRVRRRLSELRIDFIVRQVAGNEAEREQLRRATGQTGIPVLIDVDRRMIVTEANDIIAYLEETHQT